MRAEEVALELERLAGDPTMESMAKSRLAKAAAIRALIAERDALLDIKRMVEHCRKLSGQTQLDCFMESAISAFAARDEFEAEAKMLRAERDELRAAVRHALVVMDRLLPTMDPSADDDEVEEAIECRC